MYNMSMSSKTRVGVFFGGKSPEHEVSVITGLQAIENLDKDLYEVIPVYVAKDGRWFTGSALTDVKIYKNLVDIPQKTTEVTPFFTLEKKGIKSLTKGMFKQVKVTSLDVAFPCLHGSLGENGGFAGLFEVMDLPYVGSDILGGAIGMDKVIMKQIFDQTGISITKWSWFYRNDFENDREKLLRKIQSSLTFPVFVKPANGGSSIGTTKAHDKKELEHAIEVAALFDKKVIVEESFEDARELNVSVLGNSSDNLLTSVIEEVFSTGEVLTYEDKYAGGGKGSKSFGMVATKRQIPAKIPTDIEEKIKETSIKVFEVLDASGVARIDFLYKEKTKEIVVLEINSIPGSLSFYLWEATGVPFKQMLTKLIDLAFKRYGLSKQSTTVFQSNILENFNLQEGKAK